MFDINNAIENKFNKPEVKINGKIFKLDNSVENIQKYKDIYDNKLKNVIDNDEDDENQVKKIVKSINKIIVLFLGKEAKTEIDKMKLGVHEYYELINIILTLATKLNVSKEYYHQMNEDYENLKRKVSTFKDDIED